MPKNTPNLSGTVVEAIDDHYSDKVLTVEIQVPAELDQQHVSDELIRIVLAVEDQYGVTIVTHTITAQSVEA